MLRPPSGTTCASPRRSEEHTSELQSRRDLVCRLLLEKKKILNKRNYKYYPIHIHWSIHCSKLLIYHHSVPYSFCLISTYHIYICFWNNCQLKKTLQY